MPQVTSTTKIIARTNKTRFGDYYDDHVFPATTNISVDPDPSKFGDIPVQPVDTHTSNDECAEEFLRCISQQRYETEF